MNHSQLRFIAITLGLLIYLNASPGADQAQQTSTVIPKTWDEEALASLELPLASTGRPPEQIPADDYYRIPVRPIYKSYLLYHPDKEPPGYRDWLKKQLPEILWDDGARRPRLKTEADWIKAGEMVFYAPVLILPVSAGLDEDRAFVKKTGDLFDRKGIHPFTHYLIREAGKIEVGVASCADCHTRIMPDGSVIRGAQGNRPVEQVAYYALPEFVRRAADPQKALADLQRSERMFFGAPWLNPEPQARLATMSAEEIEAVHYSIPPGVMARQGTSPFSPAKVPDVIGLKNHRYLDASGLVRHRSISDVMRYAALNQGMDLLARFDDFIPAGTTDYRQAPDPTARERYSDEQLYALALYLYSLKPPPNPHKFDALAARGKKVFESQACAGCHTPPLYTNNKLTLAEGFTPPAAHFGKYDIMRLSVGTDPNLTLKTRRGTGYYKVPSLKGVWYRGPFEHNGSVATLEDWFDPKRLKDDYVPTGWKGYGVKTRAVKGHEFGLQLSAEDKRALIAFLKTL